MSNIIQTYMKFKMNRRAVSPVVAIILMFILIIAAIGISLIYMLPSISSFKDKSYNNSNNLYFLALDSSIQELIINPPPISKEFIFFHEQGELFYDESWLVMFLMHEISGTRTHLVMQDNITRFIHRSTSIADYERGEHRYLIGPQDQDYVFINGSSKVYNEVAVLNTSRTIYEASYLDLALYYRYVLAVDYETAGLTEIYNVDIIHIDLELNESTFYNPTRKQLTLQLTYEGTEKEDLGIIEFITDIYSDIRISNQFNHVNYENPLYFPVNTNYISHQINFNMISLKVQISIF